MSITSPIGVFTTDVNLNITSWNDWLTKATGFTEESVRGLHVTRVIPDIDKRGIYNRFLKVVTEGVVDLLAPVFHHYLIKIPLAKPHENFTEMQQRVTISSLNEEEIIHGTLVTIEDVTEQMAEVFDTGKTEIAVESLASGAWTKRRDVATSLASAGKTILSEVLRKIRLENRNLDILSSAMKVISMSEEDTSDFLVDFLNSEEYELRIFAAQMLGEKNKPEVLDALIRALDDPDVNVKYHTIESLGKLKAVQAIERLVEIAFSRDFFTAFPAIDALKNMGDVRISRMIFPLVEDEMFGKSVIEALGEIGEAEVVPGIVEQINRNSDLLPTLINSLKRIAERYELAVQDSTYIADIFRKNLTNEGINNLIAFLNETRSQQEIRSVLTLLGWINDVRISKTLTNYLGNPGTRKQVIEALVISGQKVVDILISQLKADSETRKSAIHALGRIGGTSAVDALIPLLKDDEVAVICCSALARIGDRRPLRELINLLGHDDACFRGAAISAINSIGHPDMEKLIPGLLSDPDPLVRESALKITGYFGFPCCKGLVHNLCWDVDINVRISAIENLAIYEDDERIEPVFKCIYPDENPKIRAAVVRALGRMESKSVYSLLEQAVRDKDGWVRYYAIKSMNTHGFIEVLPVIKDLALKDPMPYVRLAAIEYLGNRGGNNAALFLSSLTGDPDLNIELAAVRALGEVHHPDALHPLLAFSKSSNVEIRRSAIVALGKRGGQGVSASLQWFALTEKDPSLKILAVESLRTTGTRESVNTLLNLTSVEEIRELAISALIKLPEEKLDMIRDGLNHKNTMVRTAVIETLVRMHTPRASEIIAECLAHDDVNVRLAGVYALHRLGNRSWFRKMLQMKDLDPEPVVRKAIEDIIHIRESE